MKMGETKVLFNLNETTCSRLDSKLQVKAKEKKIWLMDFSTLLS